MLTDPFYNFDPAYSHSSTGVVELNASTTVTLLTGIRQTLQAAGWTVEEVRRSTADQVRFKSSFQTVTAPLVPVTRVPLDEACNSPIHPSRHGTMDGIDYVSYDAYRTIAPECVGRIYYAAGTTYLATAQNLVDKMIEAANVFVCTIEDIFDDPEFHFHFFSKAAAFENDLHVFQIGAGDLQLCHGYYLLRSQEMEDGGHLELKLQTEFIGHLGGGGTIVTGQGPVTPFLTLTSSGGGFFTQPFYPSPGGEVAYAMHANGYQFAIWPLKGTGRDASALFASMLKPDQHHEEGANAVLVVGSETDNFTDNQQLTTKLHWEDTYGSRFNNDFDIVRFGSYQESTGFWKNPTFIWRGFRGIPLQNEAGVAFAEAPYVLLSDDPNHQEPDRIGGRPWDMLLLSTGNSGDGTARYLGKSWRSFSNSGRPGDLTGSLWVLDEVDVSAD